LRFGGKKQAGGMIEKQKREGNERCLSELSTVLWYHYVAPHHFVVFVV